MQNISRIYNDWINVAVIRRNRIEPPSPQESSLMDPPYLIISPLHLIRRVLSADS